MARVTGGITGRPAGKLAGIVFGAARSRTGKVVTAREKVSPSNPNTADQQTQRTKFSEALDIVRAMGPDMYQDDWNRAVGQLPGFQSLMSIIINNLDASFDLSAPSATPLGDLAQLQSAALSSGAGAGQVDFAGTTGLGSNGNTADEFKFAVVPVSQADRATGPAAYFDGSWGVRGDAPLNNVDTDVPTGVACIAVYWMVGGGSANLGDLSQATWGAVTTG